MTDTEVKRIIDGVLEALLPAVEMAVTKQLRHQRRTSARPDGQMTSAQAANYAGISASTFRLHVRQGKVKIHRFQGSHPRFIREDLDRAYPRINIP